MAEVLHFPSSPGAESSSCLSCAPPANSGCREGDEEEQVKDSEKESTEQASLLALLVEVFRKSLVACKSDRRELCAMEIGWPTNVRHVAHVTFDRYNGFLGLPVEFEPDVPSRVPSASTHVFGVSTESMQMSYDSRGKSIPMILLLMQRCLYAQGGLQAEGIFRINAENSQEEYVREQLNRGVIPEGIDVHCLAGLIKAWFRELPRGVLDSLSPEQVIQCQTEEDCVELVRLLPPTEAALLDWAIDLMADVAQMEYLNKMNARNIAMVFAPNMTKMADPLTALMYAVQVMNFLKTLITRVLREREDSKLEAPPTFYSEPPDENGHQTPQISVDHPVEDSEVAEQHFAAEEPPLEETHVNSDKDDTLIRKVTQRCGVEGDRFDGSKALRIRKGKVQLGQTSFLKTKSFFQRKIDFRQPAVQISGSVEKTTAISSLSRIDMRLDWIEAWR